jgi:cobalamin biosynthesis Mg chelatase CobN
LGCSTTHTLSPEHPLKDNANSIVVHLHDARIIKFDSKDYTINENSDSAYLQGVGRESSSMKPGEMTFRGSIGRAEIKAIQVSEGSPSSSMILVAILGVAVATTFLVWLGTQDNIWN